MGAEGEKAPSPSLWRRFICRGVRVPCCGGSPAEGGSAGLSPNREEARPAFHPAPARAGTVCLTPGKHGLAQCAAAGWAGAGGAVRGWVRGKGGREMEGQPFRCEKGKMPLGMTQKTPNFPFRSVGRMIRRENGAQSRCF